ncbi:MAG: class I SAM-dependent methyltransferase [Nostoc sp.]|uniref:class I SAM-dependent methyltransferase n=1 Tax=Nostoc sp. TaxID=1180 RepID=UPI002FFBB89C
MNKISSIVAEKLLPQQGGDSEKERQLSEIKPAPYMRKLLERVSSQTPESQHTILKSTEAREFITQFTVFQDLAWEVVDARINHDYQRIMSVAINAIGDGSGLHLNPQIRTSKQHRMTDIHRMPGGYLSDTGNEDILAGLRYMNYLYLLSNDSAFDSFSDNLVPRVKDEFIDNQFPKLKPKRIIDLGCGIGHNTISLKNLYPDAEVIGVDFGAAMLRYAYANARLLNREIKFYQQDARYTEFQNEHFDLVTSFLLLHEIPNTSIKQAMSECARLLRPGGVMMHFDSGVFLDPQTKEAKVIRDIQTACNNEVFIVSPPLSQIQKIIEELGMKPVVTKIGDQNPVNNNLGRWQIVAGIKL